MTLPCLAATEPGGSAPPELAGAGALRAELASREVQLVRQQKRINKLEQKLEIVSSEYARAGEQLKQLLWSDFPRDELHALLDSLPRDDARYIPPLAAEAHEVGDDDADGFSRTAHA